MYNESYSFFTNIMLIRGFSIFLGASLFSHPSLLVMPKMYGTRDTLPCFRAVSGSLGSSRPSNVGPILLTSSLSDLWTSRTSLKGLSRMQSRDEVVPPESQPCQYKVGYTCITMLPATFSWSWLSWLYMLYVNILSWWKKNGV